jgi:hypothetical protein
MCQNTSGAKVPTSHFSKARIERTVLWRLNFKNPTKPAAIPKKLNKTVNFQRAHQPKRRSENEGKNRAKNLPKTESKIPPECEKASACLTLRR